MDERDRTTSTPLAPSSSAKDAPAIPDGLVVFAACPEYLPAAQHLAARLSAPLADTEPAGLALRLDANGLSLVGDGMTLRADLARMAPRIKPHNLHRELLVRAAKIKGESGPLTAVDATAGFGEDALLLAAAGFSVLLYERNPIIAALLEDALRRARALPSLQDAVSRMQFVAGDSLQALPELSIRPDIVYLDPMFPARTKSAQVKKKFQLLHHLERPCEDQDELLDSALSAHPHKIVIKRPPKGPYLADFAPSYSLAGKAVRYDCIVPPR